MWRTVNASLKRDTVWDYISWYENTAILRDLTGVIALLGIITAVTLHWVLVHLRLSHQEVDSCVCDRGDNRWTIAIVATYRVLHDCMLLCRLIYFIVPVHFELSSVPSHAVLPEHDPRVVLLQTSNWTVDFLLLTTLLCTSLQHTSQLCYIT